MPGKKAGTFPECKTESADGALIAKAVINNSLGSNKIDDFKRFCRENSQLAAKYGYYAGSNRF